MLWFLLIRSLKNITNQQSKYFSDLICNINPKKILTIVTQVCPRGARELPASLFSNYHNLPHYVKTGFSEKIEFIYLVCWAWCFGKDDFFFFTLKLPIRLEKCEGWNISFGNVMSQLQTPPPPCNLSGCEAQTTTCNNRCRPADLYLLLMIIHNNKL